MSIAGVTRELLVRYLDAWTPAALHGRRATLLLAGVDAAMLGLAEAALRVCAEFADRLGRRTLTLVVIAPGAATSPALASVRAELSIPAELAVHALDSAGGPGDTLDGALVTAALKAAGAAGAPLFGYLATGTATGTADGAEAALTAVAAGRPAEVLLAGASVPAGGAAGGDWPRRRAALRAAGFPLTSGVELVDGTDSRLLAFATSTQKSLEAYKNALWAVDEYAGVRYRDPLDPDRHLLDISLSPHPGPLRRELLAHLAAAGPRTVTELRDFTLTETVYRAQDTARVLPVLLSSGAVSRSPEKGRLSGDVTITRL